MQQVISVPLILCTSQNIMYQVKKEKIKTLPTRMWPDPSPSPWGLPEHTRLMFFFFLLIALYHPLFYPRDISKMQLALSTHLTEIG